MKKRIGSIIYFIIYISLIAFFTYECLKDGNDSSEASNKIGKMISSILSFFHIYVNQTDRYFYLIRKLIGHFSYFLVLGVSSILFYYSLNIKDHLKWILHYGIGFLFAFISEFVLELITSGRNASFKDVLIDFSGFISISSIFVIISLVKRRNQNAKH